MRQRILVPVNFTTASARALAVTRAYHPQATVRLLYVVNPSDIASATANPAINPTHAREERTRAEQEALRRLEIWQGDGEELAVAVGSAAETISEQAKQWGADLIAMGTRSRTGLQQFLHGSATEWLVRHADQPILVVHDVELAADHKRYLPPMD